MPFVFTCFGIIFRITLTFYCSSFLFKLLSRWVIKQMDPNNGVLSSGSILLVHKGPLMVFYGIILLGGFNLSC